MVSFPPCKTCFKKENLFIVFYVNNFMSLCINYLKLFLNDISDLKRKVFKRCQIKLVLRKNTKNMESILQTLHCNSLTYITNKLLYQWRRGFTGKAGRREVPGLIPIAPIGLNVRVFLWLSSNRT